MIAFRGRAGLIASCAVLFGVLRTQRASAQPTPRDGRSELGLEASSDFSVVRAPFFTRNLPELQAHGFLLALTASGAVSRQLVLRARIPTAVFSIRQPAGSYVDESVWGNPSLSVAYLGAPETTARTLSAWAELGAGLPLAEQGPVSALQKNRALEAANAASGYLEPESFTPAVVPVVLRVGARAVQARFSAEAELSLPLLFRVRDPELGPEARLHTIGLLPSIALTGSAQLFGPVSASLGARAAYALARVVEPWRASSRVQPSLSAALQFRLSQRFELSVRSLAPLAGSLGGQVYTGGLDLEVIALP